MAFDNYVLLKVLGDVMITLKFGGTSMGNARRIIDSATIMKERAEKDRISVVVSAVAGVSNKLQESIEKTSNGSSPYEFCTSLRTASSRPGPR